MVLLKKRLIYSTAASVLLHAAVLTGIELGHTPAVTGPPVPAEPIYVQLTDTPPVTEPENDSLRSPDPENAEMSAVETPPEIRENPPPEPVKEIAEVDDESTPAPAARETTPPVTSTAADKERPSPDRENPGNSSGGGGGIDPFSAPEQDADTSIDEPARAHRTDPVPREAIQPDYPLSARIKGYEGTVVIDIRVSASGKVVQTVVAQSSGHEVLDRAAVDSVLRTAFVPGMINDNPEDMNVSVKVVFSLQ